MARRSTACSVTMTATLALLGALSAGCGNGGAADIDPARTANPTENLKAVEERLGKHELLTTLLPSDATVLSGLHCRVATSQTNNTCSLVYATAMSLEETQRYYRDIYNGRGWSRLVDNSEGGRYVWRMEWRDETYKVVITVREPESWPLAPITPIPQSTTTVVDLAAVERK